MKSMVKTIVAALALVLSAAWSNGAVATNPPAPAAPAAQPAKPGAPTNAAPSATNNTAQAAPTNKPPVSLIPPGSDTRCFELRIYQSEPDKFTNLFTRLQLTSERFYPKFGIDLYASFVPVENPDGKIYMLMVFPSKEEQEKRYRSFTTNAEYRAFREQMDTNSGGRSTSRAETYFMQAADFSPAIQPTKYADPHVYELRTYRSSTNNLPLLLNRFREQTTKLFQKHGITQLAYWVTTTPVPRTPIMPGSEDTLIYLLMHKSKEEAEKNYKEFREDPEWIKAKAESEKGAGGPLTITNGVMSVFLTPTPFSPLK